MAGNRRRGPGCDAEIMAGGSGIAPQAVLDVFVREGGYATPKMDVRAAVFRKGRILMVQERSDGLWRQSERRHRT